MNIKYTGEYKSIKGIEWNNIPNLAIITGPNGSGKTQLLEIIHQQVLLKGNTDGTPIYLEIQNEEINPADIIFLKSQWELIDTQNITMGNLQDIGRQYFDSFSSGNYNWDHRNNPRLMKAFLDMETKFDRTKGMISVADFNKSFPLVIQSDDRSIGQNIAMIFFDYRISELQLQANQVSSENIIKEIGRKPWDILREIIKEAKLPFTINDPSTMDIRDPFELKMEHSILKKSIKLTDLSSGEKVLFSLVLHLYHVQEKYVKPKLILMDEPDAHLHPSMAQQFINVIKNVFVEQLDIKVIITTHSPSTVVLSPDDSIFIMSIEDPRIKKAINKNQALALLTAGLVYVGKGTKYYLVEDKEDVEFYTYVYSNLIQSVLISSNIPLVFIPASTKDKTGGKSVVGTWVSKLQESGLDNTIQGLIDDDYDNVVGSGVYKISRYSIENYFIDPLLIYSALLDKDKAPAIDGIDLNIGEEYRLKTLDKALLQKIADVILEPIQKKLLGYFEDYDETIENQKVPVKFTNDIELLYPVWLLKRRGKTLLQQAINTTYGNATVNRGTLFKALRKLNVFPQDLADLFTQLMYN